jgi:hypothetical protein
MIKRELDILVDHGFCSGNPIGLQADSELPLSIDEQL